MKIDVLLKFKLFDLWNMAILTKIKQSLHKERAVGVLQIILLFVVIGMSIYAPETFAASFETSFIKKLTVVKNFLLKSGKIICYISLIIAIVMCFFNNPPWKWLGCIIFAGTALMALGKIGQWILS